MKFDEYQTAGAEYDCFSREKWRGSLAEAGAIEKVLGLTGEAGEVADKIKKVIRDKQGKMDENDREAVAKELGDVLWYVAAVARYIDMPLSRIAEGNLEKLASRKARNVLHGEGDER